MSLSSIYYLFRDAISEWSADRVPRLGAALAYYSIFSLSPLLLIVLWVAGLVFGEQAARGQLHAQLAETVGANGASAVEELLANTDKPGSGSLTAALVSFAVLFVGASGAFLQLQDALNTIWKAEPPPGRFWLSLVKDRLLSFGLVLLIGVLLLASVII